VNGPPTFSWSLPDGPCPQIPDLDLIRVIGRGGFGQVWLATNRTTRSLRAVKVVALQRRGAADPAGREIASIIRLEARLRQHHPNLLPIHHVGQTAEYLYYIMDLADDVSGHTASAGPGYVPATLGQLLLGGPLEPERARDYAGQLLSGLACLHEAGMVHRDVKPSNCVFVGGVLKLADFGLLTEASQQASRLGTVKYMPPDRCMDARADVYAAGLVIYEMFTGMPVDQFPALGAQTPEVAGNSVLGDLNRLVLRACDPSPGQRFADARQMLAELQTCGRQAAPRPARSWRLPAAVLACVATVSILAVAALWPRGPKGVPVNFITEPYEATIHLDGQPLLQDDGSYYTTPCTVPDVPPRSRRVVFKRTGSPDLDAGEIDFASVREVVASATGAP
jgi:serine/threonine protein kinase